MLEAPSDFVIVFIIVSVLLIAGMAVFIALIIYRYQQKQNTYFKEIEILKRSHENTLLQSQLEMQEQTFQNISREIHDNISQKLTLAKLYLNTIDMNTRAVALRQLNDSTHIIGEVITDLTDLSRSMSSEIVLNNGLIKALEYETSQFLKTGIYKINFSVSGHPVFLNSDTDLVLFRIVQEVLNNIVKHAGASVIGINLHFENSLLVMEITDNGRGFDTSSSLTGIGLQNIKKRVTLLHGSLSVNSTPGNGTQIKIEIPLYENIKSV